MSGMLVNRIKLEQDSFYSSGDTVFRDWKLMLENIWKKISCWELQWCCKE